MKKYPKSYDVVVIGCGPGGTSAGKFAARGGAKTLVIDKKREIGSPVYDSASVIYGLYELENAADIRFDRSKICDYALYGNTFISPGGCYGGYQPWLDGYRINRREFEMELGRSAGRAGAEILMDTRFVDFVRADGRITGIVMEHRGEMYEVDCRIVIGAEGCPSQVNHKTGLKTPGTLVVSLGREYVGVKRLVDLDKPLYETHMVPALAGFFCWLAPLGEDRYGVGIAYQPSKITDGRSARQIHASFIENLEKNGRYDFSNAAEVMMYSGVTTTVKESAAVLEEDGFMMVGDAAWRPLIGCKWGSPGMPTAVWTGRFAGISAAEAIRKGDVSAKQLHAYSEMIDGTFEDPVRDKEALNVGREYYFKLMNAVPEMQDKIISEIGDLYSSLHLYLRGAMPLGGCVPKIAEWWAKQN